MSKVISLIETLVNNIHQDTLDESTEPIFDELVSLITLDHSLFQTPEEKAAFNQLLLSIIGVLKQDNEDESSLDYSKIIDLLDVMIPILSYEEVVKVITFPTLVEALDSKLPELEVLAIKIFFKASPPDILANTVVINRLVHLLTHDSSVKVASEVEKTLDVLLRGKLILRRLLSQENLEEINQAIIEGDQVIATRLLSLGLIILPHVSIEETDAFVLPLIEKLTPKPEDMDEIYMLNLLQFYVDSLKLIDGSLEDKSWLLYSLKQGIISLVQLYTSDDKFDFIEGSIIELYAKISYMSREFFQELDDQFIHINTTPSPLLLSSINPSYLATHNTALLSKLRISFNAIPVYRNLIRDNDAFQIIKGSINSKDLLRQDYLGFIALIDSLSRYQPKFLLRELPQAMNKLLTGEAVTEQECYQLRRNTLQNLVSLDSHVLDIWNDAIHYEWGLLANGQSGRNPEVAVFDSTL